MRPLDENELIDLLDKIYKRVSDANRTGTLEELLREAGWLDLIGEEQIYNSYESGIITVIGESEVKESILIGIAKQFGISKEKLEFCLDYEKAKKLNYRKFQYEPKYRAVLFGPVPHSSSGKEDFSSVITNMEQTQGYPKVIRIASNGTHLKITKSSFRAALSKL